MCDKDHRTRNALIKALADAFLDHGPGTTVVLTVLTMADWIGKLGR